MSEGVILVSVHHVCGHVCGTQARVLDQSRNPTLLENEVFHFDRFSKYLKQILLNVCIQHFQRNLLNGLYVS